MAYPLIYTSGSITFYDPGFGPSPKILDMGHLFGITHIQIDATDEYVWISASLDNINWTPIYYQYDTTSGTQEQDIIPHFQARYLSVISQQSLGKHHAVSNIHVYGYKNMIALYTANSHIVLNSTTSDIMTST